MHKINNNDLITGYIKQMLHDFNLPKAKWLGRVRPSSYAASAVYADGVRYMDGRHIYECSGGKLREVCDYSYGERIPNITRNLELRGPLYDSYTHAYLGDYLRFRRDWFGVDLMSMYNCFGGDVAKNASISVGGSEFDSSDGSFVLYAIPAKFGEAYTIGIDCSSAVDIVACIYANGQVVTVGDGYSTVLYDNTHARKAGCRFSSPFLYDGLTRITNSDVLKRLMPYERSLVLLLKVPASNASSLTVLEGDYTRGGSSMYCFDEKGHSQLPPIVAKNYDTANVAPDTSPSSLPRAYNSKMQLLTVNDGTSYPYADKLIGYLLGNVITPDDSIPDNIRRLQKVLSADKKCPYYAWPKAPGFWEPGLRDFVYDRARERDGLKLASALDFIGYVDRDVEASYGSDLSYDNGMPDADGNRVKRGHAIGGGTR